MPKSAKPPAKSPAPPATIVARRLTLADRNTICRRALAARFDPREDALAAREDALAREAWSLLVPPKLAKAVKAVPSDWLHEASRFSFSAGGEHVELAIKNGVIRLPARLRWTNERFGTITEPDFIDRVRALRDDKDALAREKQAADKALFALLSTIATVKGLYETWPDGAAFYAHLNAAPARLPAPRIAEINALLGLPPTSRAAVAQQTRAA